jgi:MFS family permease
LAALSIVALVSERRHPILNGATFTESLRLLPPAFRRYVAGVFIFGCGDFSHTLLILYAVQSLTPNFGSSAGTIAIELYAMHNFLYAVGSYPAGALADRIGKRGLLIGAYWIAALMNLLLISAAPSVGVLVAAFFLAGAGYALQQSLERAIVADIVPVEVRSTGFGVLASANGIGDLVSSAIVGGIWTVFSPRLAFLFALVMTAVGAIVTSYALRQSRVRSGS